MRCSVWKQSSHGLLFFTLPVFHPLSKVYKMIDTLFYVRGFLVFDLALNRLKYVFVPFHILDIQLNN
jgi:hypothetical protein